MMNGKTRINNLFLTFFKMKNADLGLLNQIYVFQQV